MKCPFCNEEMEAGFIQCRDEITWDVKKRAVAALPTLHKEAIVLAYGNEPLSGAVVSAYNCRACKKIIIDYGE